MFEPKVNCIGYVQAQFGIKFPEQFVDIGPFDQLITPYFEVAPSLASAEALAVAKAHGNRLVIHMGLLSQTKPGMVIHRPTADATAVKEPLKVALEPYRTGLQNGRYHLLGLTYPDLKTPPNPHVRRSLWSLVPDPLRAAIRDLVVDDEFSLF